MPKLTANDVVTALSPALLKPVKNNCPNWVKQAALIAHPPKHGQCYQSTMANFYTEVTVRIPTKQRTRWGKPKPQRRRIDLVALIPNIDLVALVQANKYQYNPLVVGVEIKVALLDLLGDKKIKDYLNYCHLFYLAVPKWLIEDAKQKLKQENLPNVGLLAIETAKSVTIVTQATLSNPSDKHLKEMYAELLFKPFKQGNGGNNA